MAACPHCSVTLARGARTCDRCGAPVPPSWSDPRRVPEPPPFAAPPGWVRHRDPWRGFRVHHPRGWRVRRTSGPTVITGDGRSAAVLWPQPLASPEQARLRFVLWKRQRNPTVRAWQSPDGLLRVTESTPQGDLDTRVRVEPGPASALLAGVQAPPGAPLDDLVQIGRSFAPLPALSRYLWVDPTEQAFSVEVPTGWAARGGVTRGHAYGTGTTFFEAWGEATGALSVSLSGEAFPFTTAWQSAADLVKAWLLPQRRRDFPDARLLGGEDRDDLAAEGLRELQARGLALPGARVSVGDFWLGFTRQGVPVVQQGLARTVLVPAGLPFGPQPWMAEVNHLLQAPESDFGRMQPVLEGVAASVAVNPGWKAGEEAAVQGFVRASQWDRQRRLGDLSRTLAETSDLVTGGYWERQATTAHLPHDWSNAILGYEDRVTGSGDVYSVPSGYERLWLDGAGTLHAGGWLADPDPTWTELRA